MLNLFGYTGGATLACAAAGATVCHVDASKGIVAWGKDNAVASGLADRPIRWLVDDCAKFVAREHAGVLEAGGADDEGQLVLALTAGYLPLLRQTAAVLQMCIRDSLCVGHHPQRVRHHRCLSRGRIRPDPRPPDAAAADVSGIMAVFLENSFHFT